jgi:dTDP-4-dehydrorhamnose 3,5-epimerase
MIFKETQLAGAYIIELEPIIDHRGWFADSCCNTVFGDRDLETQFVRSAIAFNHSQFTLRGLHYQAEPHQEVKLVRCTHGAIHDVIVDLRTGSPTYGKWDSVVLSAENRKTLYVPEDFAHGYLTLTIDAEVTYQISEYYNERAQRGLRYNDPAFGISWPTYPSQISNKDLAWEDFKV